jgi:type II secretory pathway component PulK
MQSTALPDLPYQVQSKYFNLFAEIKHEKGRASMASQLRIHFMHRVQSTSETRWQASASGDN